LTLVDNRPMLCRQVEQQLREHFGHLVFDTVIHRNIRLAEAPSAGETIFTYAPDSNSAQEYQTLSREVRTRLAASHTISL